VLAFVAGVNAGVNRLLPCAWTSASLTIAAGVNGKALSTYMGHARLDQNVQHIHEKAGVRSRAAATLWAFEQDLAQSA